MSPQNINQRRISRPFGSGDKSAFKSYSRSVNQVPLRVLITPHKDMYKSFRKQSYSTDGDSEIIRSPPPEEER
jgi:hypothetical protein